MKKGYILGSLEWPGQAATKPLTLSNIPDGIGNTPYRVTHLLFELACNVTTDAVNTVASTDLANWLTNLTVKRGEFNVSNLSVMQLQTLLRMEMDMAATGPGTVPVSTTADMYMNFAVPMERARGLYPKDTQALAAAFNGSTMKVSFGGVTVGLSGVMNSATLNVWAMVQKSKKDALVALPSYNALTIDMYGHLEPGIYDLMLIDGVETTFAAAHFTSLDMRAGKEEWITGVVPGLMYNMFSQDRLTPMNFFGANDWLNGAASQFGIPLIWNGHSARGNKASGLVDTKGDNLVFRMKGSATEMLILYRRFEPVDRIAAQSQASAAGLGPGINMERDTGNGRPLSAGDGVAMPGAGIIPYTPVAAGGPGEMQARPPRPKRTRGARRRGAGRRGGFRTGRW